MAERTVRRSSRAGERYCPSSGSEGMDFEDAVCGKCDHYRYRVDNPEFFDCDLGIIEAAMTYDEHDMDFPRQWVYSERGYPTCTAWKPRTAGADAQPPRLCGGTLTPEQERARYEAAMRGTA